MFWYLVFRGMIIWDKEFVCNNNRFGIVKLVENFCIFILLNLIVLIFGYIDKVILY